MIVITECYNAIATASDRIRFLLLIDAITNKINVTNVLF